jgi:hypothetical protein
MAAHLSFRERDEFTKRLKTSLKNAGLNPNSPTQLLREFMKQSGGLQVSQSTVHKWLVGDALPDVHNMEIVAKICQVCPYWLRTGSEKHRDNNINSPLQLWAVSSMNASSTSK